MKTDISSIQEHLSNKLDPDAIGDKLIVGIIGDRPSQYAKSPSIWNPTFSALGINAIYLPFDVEATNLGNLVGALRENDRLMGFNVTVPYKISIIDFLDEVDPKAKQINAVNAVVRTREGKLVGYNTDAQGGIDSIIKIQPGQSEPFIESLEGKKVLMIGAGGAARAMAHYVADAIGDGTLFIANRTIDNAESLAKSVNDVYGNAASGGEEDIAKVAPSVDIIIDASTKGQAGIRKLPGGKITCLEPYSGLASATPAIFDEGDFEDERDFYEVWFKDSLEDIEANNRVSARLLMDIPKDVCLFDLVYAPLETVFLRQGRLTGHKTINGKGMNVSQAVAGFFDKVFKEYFEERGIYTEETYDKILEVMYSIW